MKLLKRGEKHSYSQSWCDCHPHDCARAIEEQKPGRVKWYDTCSQGPEAGIHRV